MAVKNIFNIMLIIKYYQDGIPNRIRTGVTRMRTNFSLNSKCCFEAKHELHIASNSTIYM
jgi:hypothetical protein